MHSYTLCHLGMAKSVHADDLPSELILRSCICLLRTVVVAVGVHSEQLHQRTIHSLASLLQHLIHCGNLKGTCTDMHNDRLQRK